MIGPGRYDEACEQARIATEAQGILLIVLNGNLGSGFSAQLPAAFLHKIPLVLRKLADDIEKEGQGAASKLN